MMPTLTKDRLGSLLVAILVVMATFHAATVLAQTSYTPRWHDRPVYLQHTINYLEEIATNPSYPYLYVVGQYVVNYQQRVAVFEYSSSGNLLDSAGYYYGDLDVVINDVELGGDGVYLIGYVAGINYAGIIVKLNPDNLSQVEGYVVLNVTASSDSSDSIVGDLYLYGGYVDANGNVYVAGRFINWSSGLHEIFIAAFNSSLDLVNAVFYYIMVNDEYANASAWDCAMGPDGYLYVPATVYYYSSSSDNNYPLYLHLTKLDPASLDVMASINIALYNSEGYMLRYSDEPVGIDSYSGGVLLASTYTDDNPSSSDPTTAGAVVMLDTGLNVLWRINLSTSYYENFRSIRVASDGGFIVGGYTDNTYGTGLSSSVFNSLVLVFDSNQKLRDAVLAGDESGSYSTGALAVGIDASGYTYWVGEADNDDAYIAYYNVTSALSSSLSYSQYSSFPPAPTIGRGCSQEIEEAPPSHGGGAAVKLPSCIYLGSRNIESRRVEAGNLSIIESPPDRLVVDGHSGAYTASGTSKAGATGYATPGGESEGIIVALNASDSLVPPSPLLQPVPEPSLVLGAGAAAVLVLYITRKRAVGVRRAV